MTAVGDHQAHLLELMASATPPQRILEELALRLESLMPGSRCSILLLEGERLRHGAAPSLPAAYCCAIDGIEIGPDVRSCTVVTREVAERYELRSCWSSPISAPDGTVLGTFAVYHDVPYEPGAAELRLLESFSGLAAIAIRHARTVDASRATRDLLSAISHELRTPMSAIVGFSEILRRDDLPEERRAGAVEHITDAARHILGLVEDLLDLAKLDAGVAALDLKSVELAPVLRAVATMLSPLADERGVEVSVSGRGRLWADEQRLRQALLNLVGNAIKYSPAGAHVSIAADGDRIVVRDDGPGIADAERAFAPFERLGAREPGTGLGLTISKQFVEAMGGTLTLAEDGGTVATVRLPSV